MTAGRDFLFCGVAERRRKLLGNPDWNGIDYVEVSDDQRSLCLHFFGQVPAGLSEGNVVITGGRRIRGIRVSEVRIERSGDPELDDCLRVVVDRPGDFSVYRLCLVEPRREQNDDRVAAASRGEGEAERRPLPGLDPRYSCIDFTFKIGCPSDLDCRVEDECPPPLLPAPEISYLAKDYESFRQLLLDRLAVTMPDWRERHVPDIGITLVELLAYAADYLSYHQDAVATEAYLDTARRRISVRRHARLVDYRMHEGCNARAWVCVRTETDLEPLQASDFYFVTGFPGIPAASGRVVDAVDLEHVPATLYEPFEPLVAHPRQTFEFLAAHNAIPIYPWGDSECCLEAGATRATLVDEAPAPPPDPPLPAYQRTEGEAEQAAPPAYEQPVPRAQRALRLAEGDVVVFEEALGPTTGNPADADPRRRHAVRLTDVREAEDGLLGRLLLEVEWAPADALPFPLCVSSRLPSPDCRRLDDVSVACANVVLVEHGLTVSEACGPVGSIRTVGECACEGSVVEETALPAPFTAELSLGPLSFGEPLVPSAPASQALVQDPRRALPQVSLVEVGPDDDAVRVGPAWRPAADLLTSSAEDRRFVVEMDDEQIPHLRFGDGELGRRPDAGTQFRARYRVGSGPAGLVGRDTIEYLVTRGLTLSANAVEPRNLLPAVGGVAPEPIAEVKLLAPSAFRARRERAVTAEDYAELAQRDPALQRAAAELRWSGSWYEARVAVDPAGSPWPSWPLRRAVESRLERYRRMGHDLDVVPARYVPLAMTMQVCLLPDATRGAVKAELLRVLGHRRLPDGRLGFFHPDNQTFGEGVRVSKLVAAAKGVQGVDTADVTVLQRLDGPDVGAPAAGILPLGPMEIAQLENDPDFPEDGLLTLHLQGGR